MEIGLQLSRSLLSLRWYRKKSKILHHRTEHRSSILDPVWSRGDEQAVVRS